MDSKSDNRWYVSVEITGANVLFIDLNEETLKEALTANKNDVLCLFLFLGGYKGGTFLLKNTILSRNA